MECFVPEQRTVETDLKPALEIPPIAMYVSSKNWHIASHLLIRNPGWQLLESAGGRLSGSLVNFQEWGGDEESESCFAEDKAPLI